ncbi:MAG: 4a-hydroxytetrahydrobiopterin dehydratase [Spirochaetaceae bacterium]|nr:MAG: 4a-hydroxytetrahydrobiopterin dehydratase [Spirochaetaceae bacterium]
MSELHTERCIPCRRGAEPLSAAEIAALSTRVPEWAIVDADTVPKLTRSFRVANFAEALACANRVGAIAEEADHHPQIIVEWGRVTVSWWTHSIKGLHRNDFIMAARTEHVLSGSV